MRTFIQKIVILLMFSGLTTQTFSFTEGTLLPKISLSGDAGGLHNGAIWKSSNLTGKLNLLFYIDPDKQRQVRPLIASLDSMALPVEQLGMTFILNTSATLIPNFILRRKVAERARSSKNITYVLDQNRVLVHKWNLMDDDINVLLFGTSGALSFKHSGALSPEMIRKIIQKIKRSINTGETK